MSLHQLIPALNLKRAGSEWRGDCPACGYAGTFTLRPDANPPLWYCASCQDQPALTAALRHAGYQPSISRPRGHSSTSDPDRRKTAIGIARKAKPISPDDPASLYLQRRRIGHIAKCASLGFHPSCWHPQGKFPAMLAACLDVNGEVMGIHRTYLATGGEKAPISPAKSSLGPIAGCAIRLQPGDPYEALPEIVVGEGIETSAAAGLLLDLPAWAAISAGNLEKRLILPPAVRRVIIAADNDPPDAQGRCPGIRAAESAYWRWKAEGRTVEILKISDEGKDFADFAMEAGV